jgi:hypothetical protein
VPRDPPTDWNEQLQQSLRRAQDAIQQGVQRQDQMVKEWTLGLRSAYPDWGRERWQRRLEKKLRKRAEVEARIASATLLEGYVWVFGAVVLSIVALSALPVLWWLLFPAVGLASRGTRVIARHSALTKPAVAAGVTPAQAAAGEEKDAAGQLAQPDARQRETAQSAQRFGSLGPLGSLRQDLRSIGHNLRDLATAPATGAGVGTDAGSVQSRGPAASAADPRDERVDAVAEKILAELRDSPEAVREIFRKPEETVEALRTTCRDLTRRERDVRRFLSPMEDERLTRERDALERRIAQESDEVTRMRLAAALAALDQQRAQRQELARSAGRFEAEHTRIAYTLESLHTQIVRMRSADAGSVDVAGAGLRRSLDLLSQEVNALADALETVNVGRPAKAGAAAQPAPVAAAAAIAAPAGETPVASGQDQLEQLRRVADGPAAPATSAGAATPAIKERA